jgi:lipoprotein-releasing system permease protein
MIITKLELQIAIAYLSIKKFRGLVSLFSLIGIILGVATLIIVTSVMNGFRFELFSHIVGVNGHINIRNNSYVYEEMLDILIPIYSINGINKVIPVIDSQSVILAQSDAAGVIVKGIKYDDLLKEDLIPGKIINGNIEDFNTGIIIGSQIAQNFNVNIGDQLTFISPETFNTLIGSIPRIKRLKIVAIFSLGMMEYDSSLIYMPFDMASIFFSRDDIPNSINIYTDNIYKSSEITLKIKDYLDLPVSDWQEQQSVYYNALKVEKNVMTIILMLIVLIAVFNIISSLFMLVDEKKESIAILRTLGLSKFSIIKIFIMCGSLIGLFGTSIGAILGITFTKNINKIKNIIENITASKIFDPAVYYFDNIPAILSFSEVFTIIMVSITLSFLATIAPAYKAAKQEPGRILR